MSSIRVVSAPWGHTPMGLREEWVGITIPLAPPHKIQGEILSFAIKADGSIGPDHYALGHLVRRDDAVVALRQMGRIAAAAIWDNRDMRKYEFLRFPEEVCERVE